MEVWHSCEGGQWAYIPNTDNTGCCMPLSNCHDLYVLFDADDLSLFKQVAWSYHPSGARAYIPTRLRNAFGLTTGQHVLMHKVIAPGKYRVSHFDGRKLNNRRENLVVRFAKSISTGIKYISHDWERGHFRLRIQTPLKKHDESYKYDFNRHVSNKTRTYDQAFDAACERLQQIITDEM